MEAEEADDLLKDLGILVLTSHLCLYLFEFRISQPFLCLFCGMSIIIFPPSECWYAEPSFIKTFTPWYILQPYTESSINQCNWI